MTFHNISYNTDQNKLIYREYGRNVQKLVEKALLEKNRDKRNALVQVAINLMGQTHPHLKNVEEFRHKLWYQLYALSDFKLDIDAPYPVPTPEQVFQQPENVPYPQTNISFKHYGKNVEYLIDKAIHMKDSRKQYDFAKVIAGYMKMAYRTWNKDTVSDEIIITDLLALSKGYLDLSKEENLEVPKSTRNNNKRKRNMNGKTNGSNGYSNYNNNNNNHSNNYRRRR